MSQEEYDRLTTSQKATLKMSGLVLAEEKSSIQLLTLTNGAEAVFKLKDQDWTTITTLEIRYRPFIEAALRDYWQEFVRLWDES